jgi:type IV pilus assembly protein PilV
MNRHTHSGSSLFEVMVSIFVVSLGFLGFARLQITGLAMANSGLLRSNAVYLSYEMTDRMRANLPAVQAGSYNALTTAVSDPGCVASGCTPTQIAQNDYHEWSGEAGTLLPLGAAAVCLDSTPDDGSPGAPACDGVGNAFAVKVWWTEKDSQYRFVSSFRP